MKNAFKEAMQASGNRRIPAEGEPFSVLLLTTPRYTDYGADFKVMALQGTVLTTVPRKYQDGKNWKACDVEEVTVTVNAGDAFELGMSLKAARMELSNVRVGQLVSLYEFEVQNRMEPLRVNWKVPEGAPKVMSFKFTAKTARTESNVYGGPKSVAEVAAGVGNPIGKIAPVPRAIIDRGEDGIYDFTERTRRPCFVRYMSGDSWKMSYCTMTSADAQRYATTPTKGDASIMISASVQYEADPVGVIIKMTAFREALVFGFPPEMSALHRLWSTTLAPILAISPKVLWACVPQYDKTAEDGANVIEGGVTVWRMSAAPIVSLHELVRTYGFPVSRAVAKGVFGENMMLGASSKQSAEALMKAQQAVVVNAASELAKNAVEGDAGSFWAIMPIAGVNQVSMLAETAEAVRGAIASGVVTSEEVLAFLGPDMDEPEDDAKLAALRPLRMLRGEGYSPGDFLIVWLGEEPVDNLLLNLPRPAGEEEKRPAEPAAADAEPAAKRVALAE